MPFFLLIWQVFGPPDVLMLPGHKACFVDKDAAHLMVEPRIALVKLMIYFFIQTRPTIEFLPAGGKANASCDRISAMDMLIFWHVECHTFLTGSNASPGEALFGWIDGIATN